METLRTTQSYVESTINYSLANPYIMAIVKVGLALYAAQIAPKTPEYLQVWFQNTYVKLIAIATIAYLGEKDIQLAILIAIVYVFGMNLLSGRGILESFSEYSSSYKPSGDFKLIEPKTAIYPGCQEVTMDDLYKVFEGDNAKMNQTVQYSFQELMARSSSKDSKDMLTKIAYAAGLPYNLSFDKPETAPYIATLLVNYGFNIKDLCKPPSLN
jgi:hypothetical protein